MTSLSAGNVFGIICALLLPERSHGAAVVNRACGGGYYVASRGMRQLSGVYAQAVNRRYLRAGVGPPLFGRALNASIYLGSEDFAGRIASRFADDEGLREVPRMQRRPQRVALEAYAQLAAFFGLHYSSISRIVAKGRAAQRLDPPTSK